MKVFINNRQVEAAEGETLSMLLERERLTAAGIAVAVDNKVVRRAEWERYPVYEGMKLTVIRAVCGG